MSGEPCPCGSGLAFSQCCEPIITGQKQAETAEALMRSRYTGYATQAIDHLGASLKAKDRTSFDAEAAREWSANATWDSLEILRTEEGGQNDQEGLVEFKAHYSLEGEAREHHEQASFLREQGQWVYSEGRIVGHDPYRRSTPKTGRNEPCPCGSGRKYKKCCGR